MSKKLDVDKENDHYLARDIGESLMHILTSQVSPYWRKSVKGRNVWRIETCRVGRTNVGKLKSSREGEPPSLLLLWIIKKRITQEFGEIWLGTLAFKICLLALLFWLVVPSPSLSSSLFLLIPFSLPCYSKCEGSLLKSQFVSMDPWGSSDPTGSVIWCLRFCLIKPSLRTPTQTPVLECHCGQNAAPKSFPRNNDVLTRTRLNLKETQL